MENFFNFALLLEERHFISKQDVINLLAELFDVTAEDTFEPLFQLLENLIYHRNLLVPSIHTLMD
jgi:hypothetical protein